MAEHILTMIKVANPEAIQKYVKYHLPNDQASLQRIYKELVQYQSRPKQKKLNKSVKRSQSLKSVVSGYPSTVIYDSKNSLQKKRTDNLIRILKDKGLKVTSNSEEEGMVAFQNHKQRIIKPLNANSKLLKSEQGKIDRVIHRYTINSQYYSDKQEDNKKEEALFDPEMQEFFCRREGILESLKNKTNSEMHHNPKFSHIQNKLYQDKGTKISFQKIPSMRKTLTSTMRAHETRAILKLCSQQVKTQRFKSVSKKVNYYRDLQDKINWQQKQMQNAYNEMASSAAKQLSKQQYERYTNSYMTLLTDKTKAASKIKLNKYHKDLIQDEKKMRNIIDFSNK